ncbi:MAG: hypothetical protein JWO39_2567 [Gemmatimonadetes bacterium]|nr:hypothetical protein [Gemmatimonadota bacterium]
MSAGVVLAIVAFGLAEIAMIVAYQLIGLMSDDMSRSRDFAAPFELPKIEQIPVFMRHYRLLYPGARRLAYLRAAIAVHLGGFVLAAFYLLTEGL